MAPAAAPEVGHRMTRRSREKLAAAGIVPAQLYQLEDNRVQKTRGNATEKSQRLSTIKEREANESTSSATQSPELADENHPSTTLRETSRYNLRAASAEASRSRSVSPGFAHHLSAKQITAKPATQPRGKKAVGAKGTQKTTAKKTAASKKTSTKAKGKKAQVVEESPNKVASPMPGTFPTDEKVEKSAVPESKKPIAKLKRKKAPAVDLSTITEESPAKVESPMPGSFPTEDQNSKATPTPSRTPSFLNNSYVSISSRYSVTPSIGEKRAYDDSAENLQSPNGIPTHHSAKRIRTVDHVLPDGSPSLSMKSHTPSSLHKAITPVIGAKRAHAGSIEDINSPAGSTVVRSAKRNKIAHTPSDGPSYSHTPPSRQLGSGTSAKITPKDHSKLNPFGTKPIYASAAIARQQLNLTPSFNDESSLDPDSSEIGASTPKYQPSGGMFRRYSSGSSVQSPRRRPTVPQALSTALVPRVDRSFNLPPCTPPGQPRWKPAGKVDLSKTKDPVIRALLLPRGQRAPSYDSESFPDGNDEDANNESFDIDEFPLDNKKEAKRFGRDLKHFRRMIDTKRYTIVPNSSREFDILKAQGAHNDKEFFSGSQNPSIFKFTSRLIIPRTESGESVLLTDTNIIDAVRSLATWYQSNPATQPLDASQMTALLEKHHYPQEAIKVTAAIEPSSRLDPPPAELPEPTSTLDGDVPAAVDLSLVPIGHDNISDHVLDRDDVFHADSDATDFTMSGALSSDDYSVEYISNQDNAIEQTRIETRNGDESFEELNNTDVSGADTSHTNGEMDESSPEVTKRPAPKKLLSTPSRLSEWLSSAKDVVISPFSVVASPFKHFGSPQKRLQPKTDNETPVNSALSTAPSTTIDTTTSYGTHSAGQAHFNPAGNTAPRLRNSVVRRPGTYSADYVDYSPASSSASSTASSTTIRLAAHTSENTNANTGSIFSAGTVIEPREPRTGPRSYPKSPRRLPRNLYTEDYDRNDSPDYAQQPKTALQMSLTPRHSRSPAVFTPGFTSGAAGLPPPMTPRSRADIRPVLSRTVDRMRRPGPARRVHFACDTNIPLERRGNLSPEQIKEIHDLQDAGIDPYAKPSRSTPKRGDIHAGERAKKRRELRATAEDAEDESHSSKSSQTLNQNLSGEKRKRDDASIDSNAISPRRTSGSILFAAEYAEQERLELLDAIARRIDKEEGETWLPPIRPYKYEKLPDGSFNRIAQNQPRGMHYSEDEWKERIDQLRQLGAFREIEGTPETEEVQVAQEIDDIPAVSAVEGAKVVEDVVVVAAAATTEEQTAPAVLQESVGGGNVGLGDEVKAALESCAPYIDVHGLPNVALPPPGLTVLPGNTRYWDEIEAAVDQAIAGM